MSESCLIPGQPNVFQLLSGGKPNPSDAVQRLQRGADEGFYSETVLLATQDKKLHAALT